ncbi:MAG TPA: hypothetical protein PLO37_17555 [Candidatus Hydrogenedentes bacterium]|nr:hypothetical protein [Candidatus Hydrogenedentota bacterium]HPG68655.1 hypothetical protein [Candidatus Hydrogenedentota bacterium]
MAHLISLLMALSAGDGESKDVDASTIQGKTLCGYQDWFRGPGDAAERGWVNWSREATRIVPETLTFEMWPDMTEHEAGEQYATPGDGIQATLYSAENAETVPRRFQWMAQYGIHGVWLQRFLVGLPGGPNEFFASSTRAMENVRAAARQTGRVWALAFDMAAMPTEQIYESTTTEWKRLVDTGVVDDERYLHEGGLPVPMVWAFHPELNITAELANGIIDSSRTIRSTGCFSPADANGHGGRSPGPAGASSCAASMRSVRGTLATTQLTPRARDARRRTLGRRISPRRSA